MEISLQYPRFIESPNFPVNLINQAAEREKQGGGRPDFWEMVFWWTRKPLIGARAIIAGAILPANFNTYEFMRLIRLTSSTKTPHKENPLVEPQLKELFAKLRLLDPFAGFGSIPLEAMRLGLGEVVAVELLPTAYIFLKAILEYPKLYGERLIKDVERWGNWVLDNLRKDPDIKELYDDDIAVYIGSWELKCPYCGNYTPLVGNWWLARTSREIDEEEEEEEGTRSGHFSRLVWMEPYKLANNVGIRIVDLNRELSSRRIRARVNTRRGIVEVSGRVYNVPRPNIDARRETATCLVCNNIIKRNGKGEEWYVKKALQEYNESLERYLRGEISLEELFSSKARPKLLVKVRFTKDNFDFQPATWQDNENLLKALEKLKQMWGDPDIPTETVPLYEQRRITPILGADKWYKFFNPRQLFVFVKLVKLIRDAGKKIEEEKLKLGWDRQKAYEYAKAVTTYLAIALAKQIDYGSLTAGWNQSLIMRNSLSMRGIAMMWNWYESAPWIDWTGSYTRNLSVVSKSLKYLINAALGNLNHIRVVLDDATCLNKVEGTFDLIVTDPPYRDDVPYVELSDFYYVWLKRALSDVNEVYGIAKLVPRFFSEAFFDELSNEIETQWRAFALREVSENKGRLKYFNVKQDSLNYFKSLLTESFKSMSSRLADDGLLITYYAHTSPEAWEALLEAGWFNSKMRVTAAYAFVTESKDSVVARGKIRLDMSIVAVWRKGVKGEALVDEVYARAIEECSKDALNYRKAGFDGVNLFVAVLGRVLSFFTQYERLVGLKATSRSTIGELVEKYIYPATAEAIARSYGAAGAKLSPTSMFYLLAKVLVGRRPRQARRVLDRTTSVILALGTRCDLERLERFRVIERDGEEYVLLEPRWGARDQNDAIRDALNVRGQDLRAPSLVTAVDVLHLLEYYAVTLPKDEFDKKVNEIKMKAPTLFDEAVNLARILAEGLANEDPERGLADQVLKALRIKVEGTLEMFM
ncbi:MAG: DUF1156 domain-containing protein [Thermofilaceae archaeon]